MLAVLQQAVELESPSDNKAALDRCGRFLAAQFERQGGRINFYPQADAGDHLKVEFPGAASAKPILLLGHFDTVWPLGTLATMPFRIDRERLRVSGPGVLDMKSGIVMMLFALRALRSANGAEHRPVTILLDADEEIGTPTGRSIVEATARECEAVLVLEPAQGSEGHLKTARKGVGSFCLRVRGRAAHAGVDFEKGSSAIVELARLVVEVAGFTEIRRGITVNPGVINGGTRPNVVAAEARLDVDVRISRAEDATDLVQKFKALRPFDPGCTLEVTGGVNRPPMERTEGTVRLLRLAQEEALKLGMTLGEAATGGGSDGNFTSALGVPTLDGLGGVGEGAHAAHESICLDELPRRTALLAGLIATI